MKRAIVTAALLSLIGVVHAESDHGQQLYKLYCTQCHGVNADGKGINAAHMSVQPRDHTDSKEMSARTDEELFKVMYELFRLARRSGFLSLEPHL